MNAAETSERALLVFDGYCGFCTRAVLFIQHLDRHHRLEVMPWQEQGTLERAGLTREDVRGAAWLIRGPVRHRGAGAINAALSLALNTRVPLEVYGLRGIRQLQDAVYALIAANRSKLRGVRAWCRREGASCETGQASCRLESRG
jgi:predicted DCC family thiol-disulfide oxidoreductase YuxK